MVQVVGGVNPDEMAGISRFPAFVHGGRAEQFQRVSRGRFRVVTRHRPSGDPVPGERAGAAVRGRVDGQLILPNIVVVTHTGRGTGFGRVAAGIAAALSTEHDVHLVGLGHAAPGEPWVGHQHDPVLDPTRTAAAGDVVRATRPAAVVLVGEGDLSGWIATRLRRDAFTGAVVAYVPIEGPVLDPAPLARLHNATAVVAYTRVGAAALLEAMTATSRTGAVPHLAIIPHAIDPATPAGSAEVSRQRTRAELIRAARIPDAGSVAGPWLLNANRNDWRKRPELTMRAFAPIAERHPDARLLMHCNPRRHDMDLRIERARLGLVDRVILTRDENQRPWPEERLSQLYASCEIGVSTTMAEAWGLVCVRACTARRSSGHASTRRPRRNLGRRPAMGTPRAADPGGHDLRRRRTTGRRPDRDPAQPDRAPPGHAQRRAGMSTPSPRPVTVLGNRRNAMADPHHKAAARGFRVPAISEGSHHHPARAGNRVTVTCRKSGGTGGG